MSAGKAIHVFPFLLVPTVAQNMLTDNAHGYLQMLMGAYKCSRMLVKAQSGSEERFKRESFLPINTPTSPCLVMTHLMYVSPRFTWLAM